MKIEALAHTKNTTLDGAKKALYAQDSEGNLCVVASDGWEAEELVTQQAVNAFLQLKEQAITKFHQGTGSSLAAWMYHCRMDELTLAQTTGFWLWRVKRHLRPTVFPGLKSSIKARYAEAFAITLAQLESVPTEYDMR